MNAITMILRGIHEFLFSLRTFLSVPGFISKHRLWVGFTSHKLVLLAVVCLGLIAGFTFLEAVTQWWANLEIRKPLDVGIQAANLLNNVAVFGYESFTKGAYKYLILIVMELLIFHAVLKTSKILTGFEEPLTTRIFVKAQIRMIKVSMFSFGMELVATILLSVALSLTNLEFLKGSLSFLIECFFLGFALIDNYNEINRYGIKASFKSTLRYPGAAIAVGMVMYVLILIPLVGPVLGSLICAIAATIIMHELNDADARLMMDQPAHN